MTAGKVMLVPFRVLSKKLTGTIGVSADFYLIIFIYVKYNLHLCEIWDSPEELLVTLRGEN